MSQLGHGGRVLRGLDVVALDRREPQTFGPRFGRLFPDLPDCGHSQEALRALAESMIKVDAGADISEPEDEDENPTISAGFTYLGQFVDHDITFDPVSTLMSKTDPHGLVDFRTPRLDLDCVYGRGPDDEPYLYEDAVRFVVGPDITPASLSGKATRRDLPRMQRENKTRRAIIGDKRNDENKIVTQLQALFLEFHNTVARTLAPSVPRPNLFAEASREVRWHYQWIVLHDFLPRIVGKATAQAVLGTSGESPNLRFFTPRDGAVYMPAEFSGAAYRFGHSMVRPSYSLSEDILSVPGHPRIPIFSAGPPNTNLNGFDAVPAAWGINWSFFFGPRPAPKATLQIAQPSYRLDTLLVDPLQSLPEFAGQPAPLPSLAFRNLMRGRALGLPSGQLVARAMGIPPLPDDVIWKDTGLAGDERPQGAPTRPDVSAKFSEFAENAPLWYYVLAEAHEQGIAGGDEHGGHHLGPVGGLLVAEVLTGLVLYDPMSYLAINPSWRPHLGGDDTFSMEQLISFVDSNRA